MAEAGGIAPSSETVSSSVKRNGDGGLAHVLGSSDHVNMFFDTLYQRQPYVFKREDRRVTTGEGPTSSPQWPPMRLPDVEEMWLGAARSSDGNALLCFRDGKQVDIKTTPFFAYAHECSVVVNRADRFSRVIHQLCAALQESFPFVFCNVYLTPAGAQTVRAHSDDREVLAIQILGEKQWTVYGNPPVAQPYKAEEVGKGRPIDTATLPVVLEQVVRTGDVLYLPRGWVHEARAPQEVPSMHLTMAIQTSDWDLASVLRDGVSSWLRSGQAAPLARQVVSRDVMGGREPLEAEKQRFADLISELQQSVTMDASLHQWRDRIATMAKARDDDLATTLHPIDNPVQQRSAVMWNGNVTVAHFEPLQSSNISSLKWVVHMKRVDGQTMPLSLSPASKNAVEMLSQCTRAPIEVGDVPMRCPLARLALVNWLLRNGCLVRVL